MNVDHEQKIGMIVPNGKHIKKAIMDMLEAKGYEYDALQNGRLHIAVKNVPMSLTFQHQVDVIGQVSRRIFDGGWVGSERLAEHFAYLDQNKISPKVVEIGRFRLFPRRLKLAWLVRDNAEDNEKYKTPADLRGTRIVTGTPTLAAIHLSSYFLGEELPVDIDITHGGEEGQVYGHKAEAALVVVNTGGTMIDHDLRELKGGTVMKGIYVAAIANTEFLRDKGNQMLMEQAMSRLQNGRRSRTGFLMPKLPMFPEEIELIPPAEPVINPEQSQDSERRLFERIWDVILHRTRKTATIASILSIFTFLSTSAILNAWHWRVSKEKDLRN